MPTDTFNATDASDGTGSLSGTTYPTLASFANNDGVGTLFANRGFASPNYYVDNALIYFNTSTLPDDATVTAAELEIYVTGLVDTDGLSVVGEYFAYAGEPTVAGDITLDDVDGAFAAVTIASIGTGVQVFTLLDLANISKTGNTGLRLKVTKRAADAAPTAHNYIGFAAYEHATESEPILRVTYTVGQTLRPDADVTTTGWTTTPLWSKIEEETADGTVITATAS